MSEYKLEVGDRVVAKDGACCLRDGLYELAKRHSYGYGDSFEAKRIGGDDTYSWWIPSYPVPGITPCVFWNAARRAANGSDEGE